MPIIYVHGVAVRDQSAFDGIKAMLRHFVAPKLDSATPDKVEIVPAFWGGDAAAFRWGGRSRPRTALLGKGAASLPATPEVQALMLAGFADTFVGLPAGAASAPSGVNAMGTASATQVAPGVSVGALDASQKSDLIALALSAPARRNVDLDHPIPIDEDLARRIIAADDAVDVGATTATALARAVPAPKDGALAKGVGWFSTLRDQLEEAVARVGDVPGFVLTRALEELRVPLNDFVTRFTGDVFVYLNNRGGKHINGKDEPVGRIPRDVLEVIAAAQRKRPDEKTVVLSHSMGGQIVYDIVTRFLPGYTEFSGIRPIDLWCACASQVGLFEEMKLLLASDDAIVDPALVPHPRKYGHVVEWINVWDRNDIISYTAKPIFADVDDREFLGGASVLNAHGTYLVRPSFYKMMADAL